MPQAQVATPRETHAPDSFAAMFEDSLKKAEMRSGEVITAEVVRVEHNFVVVNAGLKSEAYVPIEEFKNDQGELEVQPGDFVSVAIDAVEIHRKATPMEASPADTTALLPRRTASLVPRIDAAPTVRATGSRRRPVLNGL